LSSDGSYNTLEFSPDNLRITVSNSYFRYNTGLFYAVVRIEDQVFVEVVRVYTGKCLALITGLIKLSMSMTHS